MNETYELIFLAIAQVLRTWPEFESPLGGESMLIHQTFFGVMEPEEKLLVKVLIAVIKSLDPIPVPVATFGHEVYANVAARRAARNVGDVPPQAETEPPKGAAQ